MKPLSSKWEREEGGRHGMVADCGVVAWGGDLGMRRGG